MNRQILKLAIPNIISNISVPLLSSVDTALMGQISTIYLSALGTGSMIFVFLYGSFGFLRMGTTGMSAQAYGRGDRVEITNTLIRSLLIALLFSIVLLVLKDSLYSIASYLMNIDESYTQYVQEYFDIRIYAALAQFLQFVIFGWFFGIQNALYPLYITLFVNIINIVLSIYFVNYLHMGIEGVAYGTMIAQYSGVLLGFLFIYLKREYLVKVQLKQIFLKSEFSRFFHINKDIFIRTLFLTFSLAFLFSQASKDSTHTLALMTLLLQFLIWSSFGIDGFANATESLVGKYYGAKDWSNFYKAVRYSFYWGIFGALFFSILYLFFGLEFMKLYSSDSSLINEAKEFLPLIVLLPIISFAAFIWDGVFIGMTATKALRDTIVISTLIYVGLFFILKEFVDYRYALFVSFLLFFALRGVIQSRLFYKKRLEIS